MTMHMVELSSLKSFRLDAVVVMSAVQDGGECGLSRERNMSIACGPRCTRGMKSEDFQLPGGKSIYHNKRGDG
jgi:hypothetical protein